MSGTPWTLENDKAFYYVCYGEPDQHTALVKAVRNPQVGHNKIGQCDSHYRIMFLWGDIWQGNFDGYSTEEARTFYSTVECLTILHFEFTNAHRPNFIHRPWNYLGFAMGRSGTAVEREWRRLTNPATYANPEKKQAELTAEEREAIAIWYADTDPTEWMNANAQNAAERVFDAAVEGLAKPGIPDVHQLFGEWNSRHDDILTPPPIQIGHRIILDQPDVGSTPTVGTVSPIPKAHTVKLGRKWSVTIRRDE